VGWKQEMIFQRTIVGLLIVTIAGLAAAF